GLRECMSRTVNSGLFSHDSGSGQKHFAELEGEFVQTFDVLGVGEQGYGDAVFRVVQKKRCSARRAAAMADPTAALAVFLQTPTQTILSMAAVVQRAGLIHSFAGFGGQ